MRGSEKPSWAVSPSNAGYHFGTSGLSVAVATGITHPLDVLKVRLQMQLVGQKGPLAGMGQLFVGVLKTEGPKSLYLGLTPALTRSVLYGGLRLGLYEPSKYACNWAFGSNNIFLKIASGGFAGAFATAVTNPIEVLKVRLQMNPNMRNRGPIEELRRIVSQEGIIALWKGVGPAMARAAALTASQLATYDETKRILISLASFEEGFHLHLISSVVAGTVSTFITAPMDMVKTRLMLQRESKRVGNYKNGFHCAYQVIRTEGPKALYKGGFAIFARLGEVVTLPDISKGKRQMDLEAKSFGHGLRELGGAVDLINQYKLMPHYELFCRRSIPSSISETHYLHSVVGNLKICKGEGMELEQLFQDGKFLRKSDACIRPFNLNALDDAFHMRDATSVNLSLAEKGIPTTVAKVKSKLEEKVTKRKRLDSKDKTTKECKKQKSLHKNKTYQKGKNSNFSSGSNLEDLKKQGEKLSNGLNQHLPISVQLFSQPEGIQHDSTVGGNK
ncbi:hypothetical protein G4B88_025461 [Cannabis sativa]|uniref:Mitochondrial substrate carrier family protein ucpB n=1 Tax=Cannabis sativa TaxID=3483 RepID=A0A7J6HT62_CANSA|nr:hypothetical protein G4B88_025461 [Cannabis sativa]